MRNIKKIMLILASLLWPLFVMADPEVKVNGEALTASPARITLNGDNVNVFFADGTTSSFDMDDIVVNFSSVTDVATLQNKLYAVNTLVGNQLVITGVEVGKRIAITSILGNTVYVGMTASSDTSIDVSGLASGIYLLNVDGKVVKFIKK